MAPTFWLLNAGLVGMTFFALLPAGIYQAWASVSHGLWYARSAEFVHSYWMETFVWLRVPGDILFSIGALLLAVFAVRLWLGSRTRARSGPRAAGPGAPEGARATRFARPATAPSQVTTVDVGAD